jgi:hypothetical protein
MSALTNRRLSRLLPISGRWAAWINLFASLTSLVLAIAAFLSLRGPSWATFLAIWLCLLLAISWLALFVQQRTYDRSARYAKAMNNVHDAFHYLRNATLAIVKDPKNAEGFSPPLEESATELAAAFSLVTGAKCRVCIKQMHVYQPDEDTPRTGEAGPRDMVVRDLARSRGTWSRPHMEPDYVSDNTDFELILLREERYFFSNDLRRETPYKNSHWDDTTVANRKYEYLSTIVWPIRRQIHEPSSPTRYRLLGFLCVDSLTPDAFDIEIEFGLGAAYADTLFSLLSPLMDAE